MAMDMRLISLKDGGKFAMSWIAGTNPKVLRSNFQRSRIFSFDVPDVCDQMIDAIKSKEEKFTFRILCKLCFGTVQIFSEQVQHLYDATMSFVCYNNFVLNQEERKRNGNMLTSDTTTKRRRIESTDIDIKNLMLESEIFNECYDENTFKNPNEELRRGKKKNVSTCIEIKQITIRQISWDGPMMEDDDEAFGEATQEEKITFLSGLIGKGDVVEPHCSSNRKRKASYDVEDCSPLKRTNGIMSESMEDIRCAPSTYNDSISQISLNLNNSPLTAMETNSAHGDISRDITLDELNSTQEDVGSNFNPHQDQLPMSRMDLNNLSDIPPFDATLDISSNKRHPETVAEYQSTDCSKTELQNSTNSRKALKRKHERVQPTIDKLTELPKIDKILCMQNIWQNCFDYDKKDYIIKIKKIDEETFSNFKIRNQRFQSTKLLFDFKLNLKIKSKQSDNTNLHLIIEEMFGKDSETIKDELNIKSKEKRKSSTKNKSQHCDQQDQRAMDMESQTLIDKNNNNQNGGDLSYNFCNPSGGDLNNNICNQPDGYNESNEAEKDILTLKCSIDKIDPNEITFDFPLEAGKKRSEWGKEGILIKLLSAWVSKDIHINMKTLIVGANRINAALAFHTLLDLAGQQYIKLEKDNSSRIESVQMGPEMIRKLNQLYA